MRKILPIIMATIVLMLPSGITTPSALAQNVPEPIQTINIQFDISNPQAISRAVTTTGDFAQTVIVPSQVAHEQARITKVQNSLKSAGLKTEFATIYLAASDKTGTPWQLIAAVHKIESGQAGNTTVASYAGAQGPMQFLPATYRAYALDGNGDGISSIYNAYDAIYTGANYLRAGGAARGNYHSALFNYNHAEWYVNKVMATVYSLGLK